MRRVPAAILAALLGVLALLGAGCTELPGQKKDFALGPLRFGMTVAEMEQAFAARSRQLDTYDTELGQSWSVLDPFADDKPLPEWFTANVERVGLSFWNERLFRVRLHYPTADLEKAQGFRRAFDRGYRFNADLSRGERLFLEYETDTMLVYLSCGGDQSLSVAFVDKAAYRAMDTSRRRLKLKAAEAFAPAGLRFGATREQAERLLAGPARPSDFFAGLECLSWREADPEWEWLLGFSPDWGLSAIARLSRARRAPADVQARLLEMTRAFGQGEVQPSAHGYSLTIDGETMTATLMVMDCNDAGCLLSEGWLWKGPAETPAETK
ncbi:MAG: hypothetical protein GX444_17250 [Myxococcales bacterium]|nr:hypothetical protein [Myxococcales bacterium]